MKLYFEEYQYPLNLLQDNVGDEVNLSRQNDKANIPYVGYYYNAKINDTVFILPKVFISENGKAFDRYNPEDIIDISSNDEKFSRSIPFGRITSGFRPSKYSASSPVFLKRL